MRSYLAAGLAGVLLAAGLTFAGLLPRQAAAVQPDSVPGQQTCNWAGWVLPHTSVYTCGSNYWHTSTVSTPGQNVNCAGSNTGIGNGFIQGPVVWRCSPAQNWTVVADVNEYTRPLVSNGMGWSVYFVAQVQT